LHVIGDRYTKNTAKNYLHVMCVSIDETEMDFVFKNLAFYLQDRSHCTYANIAKSICKYLKTKSSNPNLFFS
jgi:hypothetical protein